MPLYEYRCLDDACGDQVEKLMLLREYESGLKPDCPTCQGPMQRIMLPSYQRAGAGFQPIIVHESADGEFSFPMSGSAPVREGFVRRELRTFAEADAVMRKVSAVERRKVDERISNEQAWLSHTESVNRSDLRHGFTFQDADGHTHTAPPLHHMSPRMRAFAEFAMRQNDAKPRPRHFDPHPFIEVREFDRSNREAYADHATGWRRRHG